MIAQTAHHAHASKFIAVLMLASLLAVVLLSFAAMTHASDGSQQSGCPFTAMGTPLCPQDLTAAAVHHISAYQSLLNTPVGSGVTALILALLLLVCTTRMFLARTLLRPPPRVIFFQRSRPVSLRDRGIARWFSLFEHSPSLV